MDHHKAIFPAETQQFFQEDTGYRMQLEEIHLNQISLSWGSYINPAEKVFSVEPEKASVLSHFPLTDPSKTPLPEKKQFVVYRQSPEPYNFYAEPSGQQARSFFELNISQTFFNQLFNGEGPFLDHFQHSSLINAPALGYTAGMLPEMYHLIAEMRNSPYQGHLKTLHLEAKAIELFLMQIRQLDQKDKALQSKLKPADLEALHAIREYMDLHYQEPASITGLAKKAGINQMKLKNGFRELFGNTVFGYLTDLRMQEARRLLLEEKCYVAEVADRMGYKHAHHFAAAFKRKFGISPGQLKAG